MRVLFVTPYYKPAHLGGIERAIEKLAAALGRQQCPLSILGDASTTESPVRRRRVGRQWPPGAQPGRRD